MTAPGPKVLIWDIETMAGEGRFWGPKWDPALVKITSYPYIYCVSYTWLDLTTMTYEPVMFRRKAKGRGNDKGLVKFIRDLLDEADVAVAHNGDKFDIPEVVSRMAYHRIAPPEPFINVDTKKLARVFRLPSKSLNDIADYAGLGRKVQHSGYALWDGTEREDPEQVALMEEYSIHDTELLADAFIWMFPHVTIPKLNLQQWFGRFACKHCGSYDTQKRGKGKHRTNATARQNVWCKECSKWSYYKKANVEDDEGEYR